MTQRYYSFEVVTHCSYEDIRNVISKQTFIRHYAYILHDKDTNADGTLKNAHFHLFITTFQPCSFETVSRKINEAYNIGLLPNCVNKIKTSLSDCFNYLTHKNHPEKYQYDEADIVSDDKNVFRGDCVDESDNKAFQLLEDIISEELSFRDLARKYGREVILNYDKYYKYSLLVHAEDRARENQERVDVEKLMQTPQTHKLLLIDEHGEIIKQI